MALGSPPHTRGIPLGYLMFVLVLRITPAYAGNTFLSASDKFPYQDHTRIRGEYQFSNTVWCEILGSHPHTRRIPVMLQVQFQSGGITSAYAGNTSCFETIVIHFQPLLHQILQQCQRFCLAFSFYIISFHII